MHNRAKTARTAFFVLFAVIIFATTLSPTLGDYQANSATHEAVDDSLSIFSNSPTIWSVTNVTSWTRWPNYNESVPIEANVTDAVANVSTVILSYSDGTTWFNVTMTEEIPTTGLYNATIPAFPWRTPVEYMVYANNTAGEWNNSSLYGYEVADYYPPIISTIFHFGNTTGETNPQCNETVIVLAKVTSEAENASPIRNDSIELRYWIHSMYFIQFNFDPITRFYVAEIPALPWNTHVLYWVYAEDWAGNSATKPKPGEEPKEYWVLDSYGPSISNLSHAPSPQYNETVTVSTNVSEPETASGVSQVILSYFNGSQWRNITMTEQGAYTAEIPALPWNTTVNYKVYACDNAENWAISDILNYTVTDSYAPTIGDLDWSPKEPKTNKPVNVTASVSEPTTASGVSSEVILSYYDGSAWTNVTMTLSNGVYTAQIPGLKDVTNVQFKIYAKDNAGNWATSSVQEYTVKAPEPSMTLPLTITIIILILVAVVAIVAMRKFKM